MMMQEGIESIYALSPMQQGMLFHSIYDQHSGVYFQQLSLRLRGSLDISAFEKAWQRVAERHPMLRTSFVWERLDKPVQVVHRKVNLAFASHDLRSLSASDREQKLEALLNEDRQRGFELAKAPLMRFSLMQLEDDLYQFVWSHHHLLLDGWSLGLVVKEVFAYYEAFRKGEDLRLDKPRPYRDYIGWLKQQNLGSAEQYWRETFAGFTAPTPFVIDRAVNRFADSTSEYGESQIKLSQSATSALQDVARRNNLTLSAIIQAAWALLLSRYSGSDDVVFGATVSGRPHSLEGAEAMVGMFINTLPVRAHAQEDLPVIEWLKQLQTQQVEMREYEFSPLIEIQGWSDVPRSAPLFESLVLFENYVVDSSLLQWKGSFDVCNIDFIERTNYPLTLQSAPGSRLPLKITYDASRFESAKIERMLGHLERLLSSIASDPARSVRSLDLLTEPELQLIHSSNNTQFDFHREACLHHLIERQVDRIPDCKAVGFAGQSLTYSQLDSRANRLANCLRRLGVGPESLVGICLDRSIEMVVSLLAVLKSGAAYVPIDPNYPKARIEQVLQDSGLKILISDSSKQSQLPAGDWKTLFVDADRPRINSHSAARPSVKMSSRNLAYVIYTSGTTGRPKGVQIEHRSVVNFLETMKTEPGISESDTLLAVTSLSFDIAGLELWLPLMVGARVELASNEEVKDGRELLKRLREAKATVMQGTPSLWRMMIEGGWEGEGVKVLSGGEALDGKLAAELKSRAEEVWNLYGPTETTIWSMAERLEESDEEVTIGRAIGNTAVYVMDEQMREVGIGLEGELWIGGEGVGRGYLGEGGKTAERFAPDAMSGERGGRLYRTGDVVRRREDGKVEYVGRRDNQVKVRGYRIELGEIEGALREDGRIEQAVVVAREDQPGDKRIVAYFVATPGMSPATTGLRSLLKERLPEYFIPSLFVQLDRLPLTPNGKVDRKALPAPDQSKLSVDRAYTAPRNPIEESVADLWAEILGVARVGVFDNFFDLGGHSLLATQIVSRLRGAYQVELPLKSLFESPTVAHVAECVEQMIKDGLGLHIPPIERVSRDQRIPLSFAQQRLWFLSQLESDNPFYNIPAAFRVSGKLDLPALEKTLSEIVRRHESLRTTFHSEQGESYQVISEPWPVSVSVADLRDLPEDDREAKALRLATEEAQRSFDLATGPLVRAGLFKLAEQDHIAIITMHHIVADGWSTGPLINEIAALYEAFSNGRPSPLPELAIQYPDFAAWQRSWLQGQTLDSLLSFWKSRLASPLAALELPVDFRRPALPSYRGASLAFSFSDEISSSLRQLARRHGVTLFMVLIAGFKALLHRYSGQTDIVVGCDIANRNRAEIEPLIGFFVNMLVLRTDLDSDPSFEELLARVKETTLSAYHHQDAPFEKIVEALEVRRDPSRNPVFQANFVFQNAPSGELEPGGLKLSGVEIETTASRFDMTVMMMEAEREVGGQIVYSTDLFERETIERMARQFERLLESAAENSKLALSELELERVDETALQSQAIEQSQQEAWISAASMFERQVELTPEALAVRSAGEQLSYRQLNQRANQLAHYLMSMGVGPEVRVAIMMRAGIDFIVALVAALKAGAVYTPIDEALPVARKAYQIESSSVAVVLTESCMADSLPAIWARVVEVDLEREQIDQQPQNNPGVEVDGENLAYIIYTSGTTGEPKGVMVRQAGLINHARSLAKMQRLSESDRELQFISRSFDASIEEMIPALISGAGLVMEEGVRSKTWEEMKELIRREEISVLHAPAAYWHEMVEEMRGEQESAGLRVILVGGESASKDKLKKWEEKTGRKVKFINAYGPTEATITTTAWVKEGGEEISERAERVSIGREIDGAKVYVVDARMRRVGEGIAGEVMIGGRGVARGYESMADLTAERFIPDPFSAEAGARMYRTGDLGRRLRDGQLEYLGRVDEQVKVRGYRIEPAEVEAGLMSVEGVKQAAVAAVEDAAGGKRLVGWIVCEQEVEEDVLNRKLAERLPEYMRPSEVMKIERMPMTANGKVDRKALKALRAEANAAGKASAGKAGADEGREEPEGELERKVARVYEEALGIERVGARESFFALGGDSIRSIRVVAMLAEQGMEVSVQDVFQHQSVRELAQAVISRQAGKNSDDETAGSEAEATDRAESRRVEAFEMLTEEDRAKVYDLGDEVEDAYPLSQLQAGMVYHSELNPETAIYHSIVSIHLKAPFDAGALQHAVDLLVARHPIIRTSFDLTSYSEPLQIVHRSAELPVEVEDLRGFSREDQEKALAEWIESEKRRPFQWSKASLLRIAAHRRTNETFQFAFAAPHAIFDGWSDGIFLTELFKCYLPALKGEQVAGEPPLASYYRDFVAAERESLRSEKCGQYWDDTLAESSITRLPRFTEPNGDDIPRFSQIEIPVSQEVSEGLTRLARAEAIPLKSVLLAAHLRVMSFLGGQSDVITGLVSNGRNEEADGERVIGLFLNTLPFRMKLDGGSWAELARAAFEAEKKMIPFRRFPMAEIQRRHGGQSLFETAFNFTHFHVYQSFDGLSEIETLDGVGVAETNFTTMVHFSADPFTGTISATLTGNATELSDEQIANIGRYYERALIALTTNPESLYETAALLSDEDRRRLIYDYNDTRADYSLDLCLHSLVEQQALRSPDLIAVSFEQDSLSYQQLNHRANQLARFLISAGARPDSLVGICLDRSIEMVVGLLGILKAGAGYVPIDPSYPADRISFMISDSGVAALLTQQHLLDQLNSHPVTTIALDSQWDEIARFDTSNPEVELDPQNLAYMIYTSGTTGRPKGAMVHHRGIVNRLLWMQQQYDLTAQDRVLQKTAMSFDVSVWEFFWPLIAGARLVVARPGGHQDRDYLLDVIKREQITVMHFVPSMLRVMVEEAGLEQCDSLRAVISSGEALSPEIAEQFHARSEAELENLYGPTEASVDVTRWRCERGARRVKLGQAISNTRIYILDSNKEAVAEGVAGELWIGGEAVGRGYHERAEMTAERYQPDPYGAGGSRMYRTGDIARRDRAGEIEYLGREDNQIKIRGMRIEVAEVESALKRVAGVKEAVVVAREEEGKGLRLIGYVEMEEGVEKTEEEIREEVRRELAEWMTPGRIVRMERMPQTANGKIDRKALPTPGFSRPELQRNYVAPRNSIEESLAEICAQALAVEKIGVFDNFFALGGHSLLVMQVVSRARQLFNIELPLKQLFESPTIASLASIIADAQAAQIGIGEAPSLRIERTSKSIDEQLAELDQYSEEEVRALLELEIALMDE